MVQMYTIDGAMLTEVPKIILGDKVFPVDNRVKTVKKLAAIGNESQENADERMLQLLLGEKAAREIDDMNLPWPAYQRLMELVTAVATGEEPEDVQHRFQKAKGSEKQQ